MSPSEPKPSCSELLVLAALVFGSIPLRIAAVVHLWAWFVVPVGAPPLSWSWVAGVGLLWFVVRGPRSTPEPTWAQVRRGAVWLVIWPLASLAAGWALSGAVAPVVPDWRVYEGVEP